MAFMLSLVRNAMTSLVPGLTDLDVGRDMVNLIFNHDITDDRLVNAFEHALLFGEVGLRCLNFGRSLLLADS